MRGTGRLEGLDALVTGGAKGIGRSIALAFAREGARVAVIDRDLSGAQDTCRGIAEMGATGLALEADVRDEGAVSSAVQEVERHFDGLNVLVNNAGISKSAAFETLRAGDWDSVWRTNLQGAVLCTQAALPLLKRREVATVINIASILARSHFRKLSAYAASKGALESLSRNLALELAPHGIRVNCILPGFIRTDLTFKLHSRWLYRKAIERRTPLRRLGEPDDVAGVAVFLASKDAVFVTGQGITVDGGLTLNAL